MKINIDNLYDMDKEIDSSDALLLNNFGNVLESVFEMGEINSFVDVGCRVGHLLDYMFNNNKEIKVCGIDYFSWAKENSPLAVRDFIKLWDLRDDIRDSDWFDEFNACGFFDLVVCTEVAEHIDPYYCDIFMNNLKLLTKKYIVMSWSPRGVDEFPRQTQHLNALSNDSFEEVMKKNGFDKQDDLTKNLLYFCNKLSIPSWYVELGNLSVWINKYD